MSMKFIKGMAAGALMGMAIGTVMITPMNKKTKRKVKKAKRHIMGTADDIMGTMRNIIDN